MTTKKTKVESSAITVTPQLEGELTDALSQITRAREMMERVPMESPEDRERMGVLVNRLLTAHKELDAKRKEITSPIDLAKKRVQALFKPTLDAYQAAADRGKARIVEAVRALEAARQAAVQAVAEAGVLGASPAVLTTLATSAAAPEAVGIRREWTYRVVDVNAVPESFTMRTVDAFAIMSAISRGVREVPGLEIYEEITVVKGRAV